MRITFLGAARTVTGSCFLVETERTSFLVDCGMHQGQSEELLLNRIPFPFDLSRIDFMLLTHAHIDHSGRIPLLYKRGFDKPVYATKATAELCGIMLPDSGHIQEMDEEWQRRKYSRADKPVQEALYTMQDGIDACRLFQTVAYDTEFSPADGIRVVMRDAGHILGSSILEIRIRENGGETKVVFSGDLGNKNIPIMRDPTIIDGADFLVIESTYGDRLHERHGDTIGEFIRIINDTIRRGGNVVIPSFAVGRTQEIIYALNKEVERYGSERSAFLNTPVYVDSPMATSATRIFRENEDCYDDEAKEYIRNGDNPLDFPNLHFTASAEESRELNFSEESKIIISSSGMCDAGRIQHHLKHNLWRKDSTVIFVGYQALGTLGRKLVDGAKKVRIFDEEIAVKARIANLEGFSGHADRDGLLEWIGAMRQKPSKILVVHGEPEAIDSFSKSIRNRFGIPAYAPKLDEAVEVGLPLSRAPSVTPRFLPEAEPFRVTNGAGLDDLQTILDSLTIRCKKDLVGVSDPAERRKILERYKGLLEKATEEMFAKLK